MIANYHTHTPRCRHARGSEIEYVENAIARGLQVFGFSDHTPQWFPGDYYSKMRMFPEELEDYCKDIRALQTAFSGQLEIPLGVEAEYYPVTWKELVPRLQDAGVEYMILGQHNTGNEYDAPHNSIATVDNTLLTRYCDQIITAMETGKFTYVAHPDFLNFLGDPKIYESEMRRICKASIQTDTPLEINFNGLSTGRNYPNRVFWTLAAEEGCKVIFGIDAHTPDAVLNKVPEAVALSIVNSLSLNLVEKLPLKQI